MTDVIGSIQIDPEALATALAAGTTTIRGHDGRVEPWRVDTFRPLAERIVDLLERDRAERAGDPVDVCRGSFITDESGNYVCDDCGRIVGPHQFHEIRTAGFGPHWFDEARMRLRFDEPPRVEEADHDD